MDIVRSKAHLFEVGQLAQGPPTKKCWSWQFDLSVYLPYHCSMLPLVSGGWVMAPVTLSEQQYPKPAWWWRGGWKELIGYSGI